MVWFAAGCLAAAVLLWLTYRIPPVQFNLEWRLDAFSGIVRGWMHPGETVPTPSGAAAAELVPIRLPTATLRPTSSAPPTATPTPLPASVALPAPRWEKQDWNNCGPATLALGPRFFGWSGDQ